MSSGSVQSAYRRYGWIVRAIGVLVLTTLPVWAYWLLFSDHDIPEYFSQVPPEVAVVLCVGMAGVTGFLLCATSNEDRRMHGVIVSGLALKLAFTATFMWVAFDFYRGAADISRYMSISAGYARAWEVAQAPPTFDPWWGSAFILRVVYEFFRLAGPSYTAVMVFFACLAFCGQYLFYRAFCVAYPGANRFVFALFVFFLPSISYWTAAVGKDALSSLALGAMCLGYAKLIRRADWSGYVPLLGGIALALAVRPHIAAIVGTAVVSSYAMGRNMAGLKGATAKIIGIPLLLAMSAYLLVQAQAFLDLNDLSASSSATIVTRVAQSNDMGGSSFGDESLPVRLAYAPFLLFRPFPWEVHNLQAAAASLEGLLLMILFWRHRRQLWAVVRTMRSDTYTFFLLLYTAETAVVLAGGLTNFGLLVRQRVMVLPEALMILMLAMRVREISAVAPAVWKAPAPVMPRATASQR